MEVIKTVSIDVYDVDPKRYDDGVWQIIGFDRIGSLHRIQEPYSPVEVFESICKAGLTELNADDVRIEMQGYDVDMCAQYEVFDKHTGHPVLFFAEVSEVV